MCSLALVALAAPAIRVMPEEETVSMLRTSSDCRVLSVLERPLGKALLLRWYKSVARLAAEDSY